MLGEWDWLGMCSGAPGDTGKGSCVLSRAIKGADNGLESTQRGLGRWVGVLWETSCQQPHLWDRPGREAGG